MLGTLLGLVSDILPTLAVGAGPLGIVAAVVGRSGGIWIKLAAAALVAVAIAGAAVHYIGLRSDAAKLAVLTPRIAGLEASLGCPARPQHERDLFACIPARDRDSERARAEAIRRNEEAAAKARRALEVRLSGTETELAAANWVIENSAPADDGPLPKVLRDHYARERAKRGVK